jgi:hypothetical protein
MTIAEITIQLSGRALNGASTRAGFVLLGAFLASFLFIRTSARLMRSPKVPWWPGSIQTEGGLHVHHLVFGIILMLLAGFFSIAFRLDSPWLELVAAAFGIGAGLTLDEFALWLHLEDVYWAEEGRRSMDAVIVATLVAGLILLGAAPLGATDPGSVLEIALGVVVILAFSIGALLKGKTVLGIGGLVFPPLAIAGVIRLAKPGSPWARWRYPPGGWRMRRATARFERQARRYRRWQDRIGGAPSLSRPVRADSAASGQPPEGSAGAPPTSSESVTRTE